MHSVVIQCLFFEQYFLYLYTLLNIACLAKHFWLHRLELTIPNMKLWSVDNFTDMFTFDHIFYLNISQLTKINYT